jgi:hypothetical protein
MPCVPLAAEHTAQQRYGAAVAAGEGLPPASSICQQSARGGSEAADVALLRRWQMHCWRELLHLRTGLQAGAPAPPLRAAALPPPCQMPVSPSPTDHSAQPRRFARVLRGPLHPQFNSADTGTTVPSKLRYQRQRCYNTMATAPCNPGCCPQADGKTPCKRIGIMYSVWHWPASRATDLMRASGRKPVTVEDVLRSRKETPAGQQRLHELTVVAGPFDGILSRAPGHDAQAMTPRPSATLQQPTAVPNQGSFLTRRRGARRHGV